MQKSNQVFKKIILFFAIICVYVTSSAIADASVIVRPVTHLGLVGYWPLDETSGVVAGDHSGYGNNGALEGNMTDADWVPGIHGGALDFDGSDDRVNLGTASIIEPGTGDFSMSVWYKGGFPGTSENIIASSETLFEGYWFIRENSVSFAGVSSSVSKAITLPEDNGWHHIVASLDRSASPDILEVFVDGGSVGTATGTLDDDDITNAGSTFIGKPSWVGGAYRTGGVDDVRFYNRVLTAAEVRKIYESGYVTLSVPSNDGLVGYWSFEEGSGLVAGDMSGNGNDGTLQGGMTDSNWVAGAHGGTALDFDGSNDYVDVGAGISPTDNLTISAWIHKDVNDSKPAIYGFGNDKMTLYAHYDAQGLSYWDTNNGWKESTYALNIGQWYHVVAVIKNGPSGYIKYYIDGQYRDQDTIGTTFPNFTNHGRIGWSGYSGNQAAETFNGKIDDLRIYNRALSADEVQSLYRSGQTKINSSQNDKLTDGLVGLWSFDGKDMAGNTAYDRSGQGNNGTLTNGPQRAIGKIGQALDFDGVDDYVESNNNIGITGAASRTITFWAKLADTSAQDLVAIGTNGSNLLFAAEIQSKKWFLGGYGSGNDWNTGVTPSTGVWQFHALTYDGTKANWYVDASKLGGGFTHTYNTANAHVRIGARGSGSMNSTASIDDVRIYNRALTAEEVGRLYNLGH